MKLSQECIMLQTELKKFAQQVILDKVDEFDKTGHFPLENIKKLATMGILGAVIPEDFGGAALNTIGLVVVLEEISKVCPSTAFIVAVHNACFAYPILRFGSQDTKKKYLPSLTSGNLIGGFAEPKTNDFKLEKEGESYILNGKNPFVLNAGAGGPMIVFIPDPDDEKNLNVYIFEPNTVGIKVSKTNNTIGLRAAGISAVTYANCPALKIYLIGKERDGQNILEQVKNLMRLCLGTIALGIAQGATEAAIKYAKERVQFQQPIINFGMVREKIAEMATRIEAMRLLIYDAAMKRDAGMDFTKAAAMVKQFASQATIEITTAAIQIYGGYGYMKDYPVERYFRDAQMINVICSTPNEEKERIVRESV